MAEKYNASNIALEQILNYIKSGEIAIPEIQRPFVWKPRQVRDLIDSLYTGYPTGYLIISQSPNIKLKDGTLAEGRRIMIDGQQRVTALMTAIMGMDIINADFEKKRIKIAFNPAVEISYLELSEQRVLLIAMELNDCTPSHAQSIRLKKLSQDGVLNDQTIYDILAEQKPNQQEQYKFKREDIRKYFPESYTD